MRRPAPHRRFPLTTELTSKRTALIFEALLVFFLQEQLQIPFLGPLKEATEFRFGWKISITMLRANV